MRFEGGNLTLQFEIAFISLQCPWGYELCGTARDAAGQELPLTAAKKNHLGGGKCAIGT